MQRITALRWIPWILAASAGVALAESGAQWFTFGSAPVGQHSLWQPKAGNPGHGLVTTSTNPDPNCPGPLCDYGQTTFGGLAVVNGPTDPASITILRFDFKASVTGDSGGSPRIVLVFSDGGNATLRPLALTEGTWVTLDGMTGNDWDNNGGVCGFVYATTYAGVVACHPGASITGIFVVNDSGWLYGFEQVIIDNIMIEAPGFLISVEGPGSSP